MRYLALATDYDGTLATDGVVDQPTLRALERFLASGRKLIMVTGRHLPDLKSACPHLELFSRIVAENGAVLYDPASKRERLLAETPPQPFLDELRSRGVPISIGSVVVATLRPYESTVLEVIREQGLKLSVIFNKDAVMVLPFGVDKSTGLTRALSDLGLPAEATIGMGDAENDLAFLELCGLSVAVANALEMVKEQVDLVTRASHGAGVAELIERVLAGRSRTSAGKL